MIIANDIKYCFYSYLFYFLLARAKVRYLVIFNFWFLLVFCFLFTFVFYIWWPRRPHPVFANFATTRQTSDFARVRALFITPMSLNTK